MMTIRVKYRNQSVAVGLFFVRWHNWDEFLMLSIEPHLYMFLCQTFGTSMSLDMQQTA